MLIFGLTLKRAIKKLKDSLKGMMCPLSKQAPRLNGDNYPFSTGLIKPCVGENATLPISCPELSGDSKQQQTTVFDKIPTK